MPHHPRICRTRSTVSLIFGNVFDFRVHLHWTKHPSSRCNTGCPWLVHERWRTDRNIQGRCLFCLIPSSCGFMLLEMNLLGTRSVCPTRGKFPQENVWSVSSLVFFAEFLSTDEFPNFVHCYRSLRGKTVKIQAGEHNFQATSWAQGRRLCMRLSLIPQSEGCTLEVTTTREYLF